MAAGADEILIKLNLTSADALTKLNQFLGAAAGGLGNLAALVSGAFSFAALEKIEEHLHTIGKMADELGVTAGQMAGLGYVAERADIPLATLSRSMKGFSEWLVKTGQGSKNLEAALLEQADQFSRMENGAQKVALATERFGRSGLDLIPILNQGSAALAEMIQKGEMLSGVDERAIQQAEEFRTAWIDLKTVMVSWATQVVTEAGPAFSSLLEWTGELIKGLKFLTQGWADFWAALGNFSDSGNFSVPEGMRDQPAKKAKTGSTTIDNYKEEQLRLDLRLGEVRNELSETEHDYSLSAEDLQERRNKLLREELSIIQQKATSTGEALNTRTITADQAAADANKNFAARNSIKSQLQPISFLDNFMRDLEKMKQAWGTWQQQLAASFTGIINHGVTLVSQNLTAIILKTKSWKQALQQIGQTILTSIVQAIIEMGVKWVISHVLMRGAMALTHAVGVALGWSSAAQVNAQEASKTPVLAVNAAAASVSSYGAAAIIGMALGLVAIGAIIGALVAREAGGPVMAGHPYVVGERRAELFVPSQNGYILPSVPAPGVSMVASGGGGSSGASPINLSVVHFASEEAMNNHIRDNRTAQFLILNHVRKNAHLIGRTS